MVVRKQNAPVLAGHGDGVCQLIQKPLGVLLQAVDLNAEAVRLHHADDQRAEPAQERHELLRLIFKQDGPADAEHHQQRADAVFTRFERDADHTVELAEAVVRAGHT